MSQETLPIHTGAPEAIDAYRRIGPITDPRSLPPFSFETMAGSVLTQGTESNPTAWLARQAKSERITALTSTEESLVAASMLADALYAVDPAVAQEGYKAVLFNATQNILRKPIERGQLKSEQAEALSRNFDVVNWFERNNEPVPGLVGHDERAIQLISRIVNLRQNGGPRTFGDGPMLEHTISLMLQYKLWQQEIDGPNTFARLATRREDMPASGMPREKGTKVSHDVVMQLGDKTVRIQSKQGENAHELDQDRYNKDLITIVIEEAGGRDLDAILTAVGQAYNGSREAATFVDMKLEKYGLLEKINASKVPRVGGFLALAGAATS